jgi:hypothetical protein
MHATTVALDLAKVAFPPPQARAHGKRAGA